MQRVWCADEGLRHARCHIPWEPTTLRRSAEFFLLNASAGSVPPPGHVAVAVAGHPDNLCLTGLYRNTIYILLPGSGSGAALRPDRRPAQYAVGPLTCRPATSDRPEPPGAGRRVPVAAGLRRRSPWPWSWAVQASPGSSRRDCRTQEVKYRNAIYCVGGYSWCEQAGPAPEDFRHLLAFRASLRQFQYWSETQARAAGLTQVQHQLLVAIKGHPGGGPPTVSDLAAYLLLRHHSTVELVDRAEAGGLVRRAPDQDDARVVRVKLTGKGDRLVIELTQSHLAELRKLAATLTELAPDGQVGKRAPRPGC